MQTGLLLVLALIAALIRIIIAVYLLCTQKELLHTVLQIECRGLVSELYFLVGQPSQRRIQQLI